MVDERRARFARRVDAWLAADLDGYMACWAPDMVIELPSGLVEGRAAYRELVRGGFVWAAPESFEVHHLAFEDARDDGRSAGRSDVALADWTITARRRADGVLVGWRGLSVCAYRGDEIAWWREHHLAPPHPVASASAV